MVASALYRPLIGILILAAVTSCSDGVSPTETYPYNGSDYLWESSSASRQFSVQRNGIDYSHVLTLSEDGVLDDIQSDASARVLAHTQWKYSRETGLFNGCGSNTLWHIPTGLQLEDKLISAPGPNVAGNRILCLDEENIIVGTDADGLFHYNIQRGEWYTMTFPGQGAVTALCKDSNSVNASLYAATGSDGIYTKLRNDSTWRKLPAPAGSVTDLEISGTELLFALIDGRLWFSMHPFGTWTEFRLNFGNEQLNDIALVARSTGEEFLLLATQSLGVIHIQLLGSMPGLVGYAEQSGFENIKQITTLADAPYIAVGISAPPHLYIAPEVGVWVGIPFSTSAELTCVAQSPNSGTVLIGSSNGVYRFSGSVPVLSGLTGHEIRTIISGCKSAFFAATDAGCYRTNDEGRTWTRIDGGNVMIRVSTPWQLLPRGFAVNSSWVAATLVRDGSPASTLTGRVLNHFDELILPDEYGRFDDAIMVRYAEENPDGSVRSGTYVWTAYFVRGRGLVHIEESRNGQAIARTYLDSE